MGYDIGLEVWVPGLVPPDAVAGLLGCGTKPLSHKNTKSLLLPFLLFYGYQSCFPVWVVNLEVTRPFRALSTGLAM